MATFRGRTPAMLTPRPEATRPLPPQKTQILIELKEAASLLANPSRDKLTESAPMLLACVQHAIQLIETLASTNQGKTIIEAQELSEKINRIAINTEEIKTAVTTLNKRPIGLQQPPRTWADIARTGETHANSRRDTHEIGKEREIILRPNEEIAEEVQRTSIQEIAERLKKACPLEGANITGVRKLPSGDIIIRANTVETKQRLEKNTHLQSALGGETQVIRRTFAVLAHGIRISIVNTNDQLATAKRLQDQNSTKHPGLEILRTAWPKQVHDSGKTHSSLIVEVASATQANRLIEEGLVEGYDEKQCELFDKTCRLTLCFRCHKYGHRSRACKNDPFCSICGGRHDGRICKAANKQGKHCGSCYKSDHGAWMEICPERTRQRARTSQAFRSRRTRYPVANITHSHSPSPGPVFNFGITKENSSQSDTSQSIDSSFSSHPTSPKKRRYEADTNTKAKQGRPSLLVKAGEEQAKRGGILRLSALNNNNNKILTQSQEDVDMPTIIESTQAARINNAGEEQYNHTKND